MTKFRSIGMTFILTCFSLAASATVEGQAFLDRVIKEQEQEVKLLKEMRKEMSENISPKTFHDQLLALQRELNEDFSRFTAKIKGEKMVAEVPKVEIKEEKDGYDIKALVPGMDNEDVKVSLQGDELIISGIRRDETKKTKDSEVSTEFSYGEFSRIIELDEKVDPRSLKVNFDQGIVRIHLEKLKDKV